MSNDQKPFHQVMVDTFLKPRISAMKCRADKLAAESATLYTKATAIRDAANLLETALNKYMESYPEQFNTN